MDWENYMVEVQALCLYQKEDWHIAAKLGMINEFGEALGVLKKALRGDCEINEEKLLAELGDTLWYIALLDLAIENGVQEVPSHREEFRVLELDNADSNAIYYKVEMLAKHYGYEISDLCEMNIQKLKSRQERGTLRGSGDDR